MGLVKKKKKGSALSKLRKQKDIHDKIKRGEAVHADDILKKEALVLLLDASPSMGVHEDIARWRANRSHELSSIAGHRAWDAAVRAARALFDASTASTIGAVVFDRRAPHARRHAPGVGEVELFRWLNELGPENGMGTDFTSAINAGLDLLSKFESKPVRRMILLTDGRDGGHSGKEAKQTMLRRLQSSSVILDTVGFGDVDHDELKRLAKLGGGTYHHTVDGAALVQEFKKLEAGARGLLGSGS